MEEMHCPTDAKESRHKTTKTIQTVLDALPVSTLRHQSEHYARDQRKENRKFKMIEVDFHLAPASVLLLSRNLIRVDHRQNI